MIIEKRDNNRVYTVIVSDEATDDPSVVAEANRMIDKKIAYDKIKPAINKWKADFQEKRLQHDKLKEQALQHYYITATQQEQALISQYHCENIVISNDRLSLLWQLVPAPIVQLVQLVRSRLDYNILQAYWDAEQAWTDTRNTYPQ